MANKKESMAKELKKKYKWITIGDFHQQIKIKKLPTKEELDKFICYYMRNVDRCLSFEFGSTFTKNQLPQRDCKIFLKRITELSLKYYPWQFRTCVQQNSTGDVDWTEVGEWIADRYKE